VSAGRTLAVGLVAALFIALWAGAARAEAWKFVVFGDTRGSSEDEAVNSAVLGELANAAVSEGAKFILVPGDLVYSGSASAFAAWRSAMQPAYDAGIGVYPIRGNHDVEGDGAWGAAFGADLPGNGPAGEEGMTWSFTYRNALVIGLDEYSGHDHRVPQAWLDAQLAANDPNLHPHVFVFGHEPAFKVEHADCLGSYPDDRNAFWSSIAAAGGRSYFAGHDHFYDHARLDDGDGDANNDLHQFVVGTGGAPFYSGGAYDGDNGPWTPAGISHDAEYGYLLVEIDGLGVTMTFKQVAGGGAYDTFSYRAVPEPATLTVLGLFAGWGLLRRRQLRASLRRNSPHRAVRTHPGELSSFGGSRTLFLEKAMARFVPRELRRAGYANRAARPLNAAAVQECTRGSS
jgi:predicted phosphodiesterase